jgi:hypothetical protein
MPILSAEFQFTRQFTPRQEAFALKHISTRLRNVVSYRLQACNQPCYR